ncbi:MAG: siderophore enterobactin receptor PfeA [Sediminibacterium sp.]
MSKTLTLLTALLAGSTLSAQKDSVRTRQLDEVVVTASRADLKQSQTGKVVTVIDQQMIRNSIGRSLSELLNTQAGFFINGSNNALGTNQDVYFRGAGSGSMLVVIDGTPVFDPSLSNNSFDLNSIALDQVEKIEILKGGQSTLWGSDAVAGVIQIFLKKGDRKKAAVNASAAYGSYHTFRGGLGIGGTVKDLDYLVQYSHTKTAGFATAYDSTGTNNFKKDGFEQNALLAELNYKINTNLTAKAFGNFSTYNNDLAGGAFLDEKDYTAKNNNTLSGLSFHYRKHDFTWNLAGSYQQVKRTFVNDSGYVSSPYSKYFSGRYIGNTTTLETFGNKKFNKNIQLIAGLQYIHQNSDQSYFSTGIFGPYKSALGKDSAVINQASLYGSLLLTDLGGFNFEAGGRINKHSIYGTNATYTINPSFNIDENAKLFINISSAYKIPSLYQLYSEYGNKGLRPEKSVTYELGLQTQSSDRKIALRFVAFKRDTRDLIIFYTDPVTYNSQYINRDEQHDYGFEVESNTQLAAFGNWSNNFSFVDGQGVQNKVKTANLYRRPKFTFNSALTLQPCAALTVIPSFKYVGSRLKGPYDAGPAEQPHYYTIDLFAGYSISRQVRLFADFRNITDQQYFDIVGYNSRRFNMMAGITVKL